MVVQLVLTPAMIKCFQKCTEEGSYLRLFEEYEQFFESLKRNLCKVKFSEPLYSAIIKESEFLLNCLSTWAPKTSLPWDKEFVNLDLYLLAFLPRFELAMQTRNWNDFYNRFLPIIDLLIEAARRQGVIDLKIGFGSALYDTFHLRDKAVSPQETQNHCSVVCTSGHSSPFDCNSNCTRTLRSLHDSKRIIRKNVTEQLVLTEEMISCFHDCAEKRDFKKLFEDYSAFFDILLESLRNVNLNTDSLSTFLFKNSKILFGYLTKWDPNEPLRWDNDAIRIESCYPGLISHLHIAMVMQDWDDFYQHHWKTADMLIKEARAQELIDLKIEYKGKLYDTFEDRDAPEQQHYNAFIRKYNSSRHYSSVHYSGHETLPPMNFLRRTLSGVKPEPILKGSTGLAASKSLNHVRFVEPKTTASSSITRVIPIKLVPSSVPEVKKTVSAAITKVKELGLTRAPEVKKGVPSRATEVRQTAPAARLKANEIGSNRVPQVKGCVPSRAIDVRKTVTAAIPKTSVIGSTRAPQVREGVPNRATEVRKTVPTTLEKASVFGSTRAPQVKGSVPIRATEVRKTVPAVTPPKAFVFGSARAPQVEGSVPIRATEVRKTVPAAIPKVKELSSRKVVEAKETPKVFPRLKPEDLQVNQQEDTNRLESRIQKLVAKELDLIRVETDRKYKTLNICFNLLKDNLTIVETSQRTIDQKLKEMESRFESSMEMKLKKLRENTTSEISQNKNEDSTKDLKLLEEKLQFRELILHQKIDEIKIREQTLDNRMNELMELMERKMNDLGAQKLPDGSQDDSRNHEEKTIPEKSEEDVEFDRKLAEQLSDYEVRLRKIQEKRKEMNEDS